MTEPLTGQDPRLRVDVLLRDGVVAQVRPVEAGDEAGLLDLNARVSLRTRYRRYFSASDKAGDWYVDRVLATLRDESALVALVNGQLVALASFARLERDPHVGDLALLVDDAHQSEGVGALLLEHLAHLARSQGITRFSADVLVENTPMQRLLKDSGFATTTEQVQGGVRVLTVDLQDSAALRLAVHRREAAAERASLAPLLAPRSVAVVGSAKPGSVAERVTESLTGRVRSWTLVGPEPDYRGKVHRVTTPHGLLELPGPVDLVVVAVPAAQVLEVAQEAAWTGAKALLVLSAGFAEAGPAGRERQQRLLALCRERGLRLLGPNCLGVVNTDPEVRLNATFCDAEPRPGRIGLVSQSGAVGIAALRHAERRGAGISVFASTGNKADVSGNDLLCYLEGDPRTSVIALYLESFGNPRKFVRVASAVGQTKPVVVLKSGTSEAGARAGLSHTAAAMTSDSVVDALLRQAGVIRATDLPEMFDVLTLLESAPLPGGHRVAVVGNSGGPGVLAADACDKAGLQVAGLAEETSRALAALAPADGSVTNPVDLLATVTPEAFEAAVAAVLHDPGVDAVVTIYTPLVRGADEDFARALLRAHLQVPGKTLVATFPGLAWPPPDLQDAHGQPLVPCFEFPEQAVNALGLVAAHAAWRRGPLPDLLPEPVVGAADRARAVLEPYRGQERWLPPEAVNALLEAYGIPTEPVREVHDADEAVQAAEALGFPVALKAVGPLHKSDVGGVVLSLAGPDEVRAAHQDLQERLGASLTGVLVQRMRETGFGLELLVGVTVDPAAGPVVLVGAGGVDTDLLQDRAVRMPAGSPAEAVEQLSALRCARRFDGFRSRPPLDRAAAAHVVMALGRLALDLPEVQEIELNPLVVNEIGVSSLDARARVGVPRAWPDLATRSLAPAPRPPSDPALP
jgi:acyl-CoA synthetase (NDP forming)/GNAT superfamily N-acetyltransferase